jgi:FAD/FMN-containing dehydrogenase
MDPISRIKEILGPKGWIAEPEEAKPFLSEWRGIYVGRACLVARPATVEEVSAVLTVCYGNAIPVVPQGGNTGLCAAALPRDERAVLINLGRMNRLRAIDPANQTMTVEAGCILQQVQQFADRHGLLFPLSLGAEGSCQIGGNLATNAGGNAVLKYGNARELTLGLEVALANGQVWNSLSGLRKDNTGYDLKQILIGSEGTLGVITAATLKLFPKPKSKETGLVGLPSLEAAIAFFGRMRMATGDALSAFELIPRFGIELALRNVPGTEDPLASPFPWYVLFELSLFEEREPNAASEAAIGAALDAGEVEDGVIAQTLDQARRLWFLREAIVEGERLEMGSVKHDVSLVISNIPDFIEATTQAVEATFPGLRISAFGHIGDGNIHFNVLRAEGQDRAAFLAQSDAISTLVYDAVTARRGSISAEHGIGLSKLEAFLRYTDPREIEMMKLVKKIFDPKGIMNPGKVLG